jgi:hypothetical protein
MNPLKERRTVTTAKAITTLFICGSLLVGFMGMSLSFTQTAMAQVGPPADTPQGPPEEDTTTTEEDTTTTEEDTTTTEEDTTTTEEDTTTTLATPQGLGVPGDSPQGPPLDPPTDTPRGPPEGRPQERQETPQCPPGTDRFVQGQCEADPELKCPPNAPPDAAGDCISPETLPKELKCPEPSKPGATVEKRGDKCIESANPVLACPGTQRVEGNQCVHTTGRNAGQVSGDTPEPTCAPGKGGPGGSLKDNGKCEKDVTAQSTQGCPSGTKEIQGQCHIVKEKVPTCPSDDFDLINPNLCQTRPGQGNR